mgnify:CR=1 FL=1
MPDQLEKLTPKEELGKIKPTPVEKKEPIELTEEEDKYLIDLLKKAKKAEEKGDLETAINLYLQYKEEFKALREKKEKEKKKEVKESKYLGEIIGMKIIEGTEVEVGGYVLSCQISPDGIFAIIGSSDNKARLAKIERDKKTGEIIGMKIIEGTEVEVGGWVYSCQISPDGTFAIIGSGRKARLAKIEREEKEK